MAQHWELGGGLGAMNYKGDISPLKPAFSRLGGNLFVRYNMGRAVSLKANLLLGSIGAADSLSNDPFNVARNHSFRTNITEISPQFEYNFFNYRDEKARQRWTPYVFAGVALFSFRVQEPQNDNNASVQIALPFGVGFKYVLKDNWNLGLEFGARKTFTDDLDNLSGPLVNNRLQNGNPYSKDMYFYTGLMVSYTFYKVRCPEFY